MQSDISDIKTDTSDIEVAAEVAINRAIGKMHQAAFELQLDPWISKTVESVSISLESEFGIDRKEISLHINDKLLPVIACLVNPNHRPITECAHAWIYKSASRYCLNMLRHLNVIEKHEQAIAHENLRGKINSVPILRSADLNPEERLLLKEAEEEREERTSEIRARVRRVMNSFKPEYKITALLWVKGWKPPEIASHTGTGLATVYRRLCKVQKAIIKEIEIGKIGFLDETTENKGFIKNALRELVANSLQGQQF